MDLLTAGSALLSTLLAAGKSIAAVISSNTEEAQAQALASLDAQLAQVAALRNNFTAALIANKAEALKNLHDRFAGDGTGAGGSPTGSKP